jgi:hypothetical protein
LREFSTGRQERLIFSQKPVSLLENHTTVMNNQSILHSNNIALRESISSNILIFEKIRKLYSLFFTNKMSHLYVCIDPEELTWSIVPNESFVCDQDVTIMWSFPKDSPHKLIGTEYFGLYDVISF